MTDWVPEPPRAITPLPAAGRDDLRGMRVLVGMPGLGWTLLNGVYNRDYPVVQGAVMLFAVTFALMNLVVDLLYTTLDPRIRY